MGEVLAYVAGEGFASTMQRLVPKRDENPMWENAQRFRQRYVVNAIEDLLKVMTAGRF